MANFARTPQVDPVAAQSVAASAFHEFTLDATGCGFAKFQIYLTAGPASSSFKVQIFEGVGSAPSYDTTGNGSGSSPSTTASQHTIKTYYLDPGVYTVRVTNNDAVNAVTYTAHFDKYIWS